MGIPSKFFSRFNEFFNGGCQNCKAAADTFGFQEKHVILDDRVTSKVVMFINHNRVPTMKRTPEEP
jgi:hypothetical protein